MQPHRGDAAAIMLAAAVIGYSIFERKGLYEAFDFGVALAILIILVAYVWPTWRTVMQSVAVSLVVGGCSIPIVGYAVVLLFDPDKDHWPGSTRDNVLGTACWIIFGGLAYILDRRQNTSRAA